MGKINLKKLFKKIPNLDFSLPEKKSVLIFDDIEQKIFKKLFQKKKIYFIKARNNTYNFFALIYASIFCLRSNFKIEYLNFFFVISSSKILITSSFKRLIIFQIKNFYPQFKILVIQNGLFGKIFFDLIKKSKYRTFKADYFFCFSKVEVTHLKNYIQSKYIVMGSFRNNYYSKNQLNIKNQIVYISQYRKNLVKKKEFKFLYDLEKKVLPMIFNYSKDINVSLLILPGESNFSTEYSYYKKILKSNKFILLRRNVDASYKICDESNISVGLDSTLVFENLSRGNKVAFFSYSKNVNYDLSINSINFLKNHNNKFCSNNLKKKFIYKVLDYVYFSSKKKWKSDNIRNINLIPYDGFNKKILKTTNQIIENYEKQN